MEVRPFLEFYNKIKNYTDYNDVLLAYNELQDQNIDNNNKQLITSLLDKQTYTTKIIPIPLFGSYNINQTKDKAQLLAFKRILNIKNINPIITNSSNTLIKKNCPHCNNVVQSNYDTEYIICGYNESGYDWKGCGNDWCFKCNKKLCKNWFANELFNTVNRNHNNKCCYKHSIKQNNNYLKNYCQCLNLHVLR